MAVPPPMPPVGGGTRNTSRPSQGATRLRLVDRRPELEVDDLLRRFVPPRRFAETRFDSYAPNPAHPSQAAALAAMEAFAAEIDGAAARSRWRRRRAVPLPGRYLDGGFGVGKTHLLAALFSAVSVPAVYLSFPELTALVGLVGLERATSALRGARLLCIDEFELDDPAETRMSVSLLSRLVAGEVRVAVTSNALPERLGEGRFHAHEFLREMAMIAGYFAVVRLDGPDFRARDRERAAALVDSTLDDLAGQLDGAVTEDTFPALLEHLRTLHPARYTGLFDGLDAVLVRGLAPIPDQADALRFVRFVDECYDAQVLFAASGCAVTDVFAAAYRQGSYRKKYGRAESRLLAMLSEGGHSSP